MTDEDHCDFMGCSMLGHYSDPGLEGKWCQHHRRRMLELTTESRIAILEGKIKQVTPLLETMLGYSIDGHEWEAVCGDAITAWSGIQYKIEELGQRIEQANKDIDQNKKQSDELLQRLKSMEELIDRASR